MWFAVALFFFDVAYVCWKQLRPGPASPAPIQPKWRHIWITGAVIAVLAFLIRTVQPIGTNVLNMQLCFFAQYVILFALGIVARRRRWLEQLTDKMAFTALGLGTVGALVAWAAMAAILHTIPNSFHMVAGGWNLPAAIFVLWEYLYCVTICTGLLGLYRHFYNRRGPVEAFLSDNAFGVYFIHPPVLIGITLLMTSWAWPPVAKFAFAAAAAILASYAVTSLVLRRTPLLRRVL